MLKAALAIVASLAVLAAAATAATPKIRVKPKSLYPGEVVRVYGSAAGCQPGNQVTLTSRAFSGKHEFAGVPAIFATVKSDGSFSERTRIPSRRHSGRYSIGGRCGGGNLGVTARLKLLRERRCGNFRVDQTLRPSASGKFGAFGIRTRRTGCHRARRLASRYVRLKSVGGWRCKARTVENQVQRVRCTAGRKRVGFRNLLPSG